MICSQCNKEFIKTDHRQKYCSKECSKRAIKKYTKKILNNRLARLKTNNEITDKKNIIKINNKGFKFLNIVIFIFYLIKKI